MPRINFASDNYAGVHPEIMQAIVNANTGPAKAYGEDELTQAAINKFKHYFGSEREIYFTCNGTAANVTGLRAVLQSYQAVICSDCAHLQVDECGAIENYVGCKLLLVPNNNGKISTEQLPIYLERCGDQHHVQPAVISITQSTEYGTVYSLEEIESLAKFSHDNGLYLHMDGSRLCNAAATLKTSFAKMTFDAGVDLLTFGGTKAGMMLGEAVIFSTQELAKNFLFIRKQSMQLLSKMRFVSAQFLRLLEDDLGVKLASLANESASYLADEIKTKTDFTITKPVQSNAVFVIMPRRLINKLKSQFDFYTWNETLSEVRLMTSFNTTKEEIDLFIQCCKRGQVDV